MIIVAWSKRVMLEYVGSELVTVSSAYKLANKHGTSVCDHKKHESLTFTSVTLARDESAKSAPPASVGYIAFRITCTHMTPHSFLFPIPSWFAFEGI